MPPQPAPSRPTCSYCCRPFTAQDPGFLVESHKYLAALTSPAQDPSKPTCAVVQLAPDLILCRDCREQFGYYAGADGAAEGARPAGERGEENGEGGQRRRRPGRPLGSPTGANDLQLYLDWKAAQRETGVTKAEFLRARNLPQLDLAAIERGRAQEKRRGPGRN